MKRREPEKSANEIIYNSAWRNCYWFARMLLNTDQYSAPGKNEKFMSSLVNEIEPMIILDTLPENDKYKICREYAAKILKSLGRKHVSKVLSSWDILGLRGCLSVEREEVITGFTKLRAALESLKLFPRSIIEDNAVLTAYVQEFERRTGQKRKRRAGGSLEDVVTFLFNLYGFKSHPKPEHFQSDIEVDKWFKCRDGWSIGISCKRTLRERWKQVSSADGGTLGAYKIREIWHLITYDSDLSDDKITMLGRQRHVFWLDDESERYITASGHSGMKDYVRPLSSLIDAIAAEQGRIPT